MFGDILGLFVRNVRLAVTIGVVTGAVTMAGIIGWLTAPVA